jgi:ribonuclease P protein component
MKKINIIKKNNEYSKIINSGLRERVGDITCYYIKTEGEISQFGFSISKKSYNAVNRNRIRRQIKEIIDKNEYKKGYKCIIMIKKGFAERTFLEKTEMIEKILNNIGIKEGKE